MPREFDSKGDLMKIKHNTFIDANQQITDVDNEEALRNMLMKNM